MYVYTYTHICLLCAYVMHKDTDIYIHAYLHIYIHMHVTCTYIQTYIYTCIHTHTYKNTCIAICIYTYIHTFCTHLDCMARFSRLLSPSPPSSSSPPASVSEMVCVFWARSSLTIFFSSTLLRRTNLCSAHP